MIRSVGKSLDFGFPAFAVVAFPEFFGVAVFFDAAGFWVDVEGGAGAPGDVAEVAELGAEVAFLDFGIEFDAAAADGVEEIFDVDFFAAGAALLFNGFSFQIEDSVAVVNFHTAVVAVEGDEWEFLVGARMATAAIPTDANLAEVESGDGGVGSFLVVVEMVA